MTTKYVVRVYEVRIPDDHATIDAAIDEAYAGKPGDAEIVKGSNEAIAQFLSYQYDAGNFTDIVDILDTTVKDLPTDVEEFEIEE